MKNSWRIGSRTISPMDVDDADSRGILWIWEEPRANADYIVSVDPTVGKTGWSRWSRTDDDMRIDNAVVEVLRAGVRGAPDIQVAEFAAPIDAVELAPVVNAIGRLYPGIAGADADGQAQVIGEVTGPGAVTLRELINRFGYTNHWLWTQWGGMSTRRTGQPWWYSSRSANKDLWMRGLHHLHKQRVRLASEWLVEEMSDTVADTYTLIGEARNGRHDDRVMALLFGLWALHDWTGDGEGYEDAATPVSADKPINFQATDLDDSEVANAWDEMVSRMFDR